VLGGGVAEGVEPAQGGRVPGWVLGWLKVPSKGMGWLRVPAKLAKGARGRAG